MQTDPRRECVGEQVSFKKLAVVLPYSQNIQKHQEDLKDHSALFQPAVLSIHLSMVCLCPNVYKGEGEQNRLKGSRNI